MFRECDYIKTHDGIIFIVRGYHNPLGQVRATPVYFPDKNGDKIERSTGQRYFRKIESFDRSLISSLHPEYISSDPVRKDEPSVFVPITDIATHYKPEDKMQQAWRDGILKNTIWENLIAAMHDCAQIPIADIGIFGSYLVDLNTPESDIDVVVYGIDNVKKLRSNFEKIINKPKLGRLDDENLLDAAKWHSNNYKVSVDRIFRMTKRQWSRIRCGDTRQFIKFAYKQDEIPGNIITTPPLTEIKMNGIVADAFGTHFSPRIAKIETNGKIIDIATYFWSWSSCVADGDDVEIFGYLRKDGEREYVTLDLPCHYISPLN
jgi:predicted nucleotidyltransferase